MPNTPQMGGSAIGCLGGLFAGYWLYGVLGGGVLAGVGATLGGLAAMAVVTVLVTMLLTFVLVRPRD